ncbi:alkene reductase [Segnochrobactraceae bacterium EtOH-i3]
MPTLFDPVQAGALTLPNRIIMAPLTRCRAAPGRVPTALMAEYYRQRASAGLIINEATAISPTAVGYPDTPGLWSAEQVAGWKLVTDAVHEAGGRIVAQLWHVGRISDPEHLAGALPVAPSAIAPKGHPALLRPKRDYVTPRALETDEIPGIIADYARAAANAREAGFDGVEIHGANGYLPHQFLNPLTNLRTDSYGGPVENRARFLLEATDAAIGVWGAERVGVHISPQGPDNDMPLEADPEATFGYLLQELSARGIAFLFVRAAEGSPGDMPLLRQTFKGTYIANGNYDADSAAAAVASGKADAVSFGRPYIANPDLVARIAAKAPLNALVLEALQGGDAYGYTDYPVLADAAE